MQETGLIAQPQNSGMMAVAETRQVQEVQAAMIMAKKFPRDEIQSHKRIMSACSRKGLAEVAIYSYPRGNTNVTGPSIRLAEALQQAWGNMDAGWMELERKPSLGNVPGESTVMVYAVDLETNARRALTFTVKHRRDTKKGGYNLTEERDIYEIVANQAARRLRACILGVIPKDVQEEAVLRCEQTIKTDKEPLADRIKKMVVSFDSFGVTIEMIEKRLGHKLEATSPSEFVQLVRIYNSINDGMGKREDFFELPAVDNKEEDAKAEPSAPQAEVKSIKKPKNHAPQTQEEAEARQAQPAKSNPQQQAQPASTEKGLNREALQKEILSMAREKGLDSPGLAATFMEVIGKPPSKATNEDLEQVLFHLGGQS